MANHVGSEGSVTIAGNILAEMRNFSIEETGDTIEDSIMGDSARTFKAGLNNWTASIDAFWDETDTTAQGAMTIGAEVVVVFQPEGAVSTDTIFTGNGIITGLTISSTFDGMVEATFAMQGNGALVESVVV